MYCDQRLMLGVSFERHEASQPDESIRFGNLIFMFAETCPAFNRMENEKIAEVVVLS